MDKKKSKRKEKSCTPLKKYQLEQLARLAISQTERNIRHGVDRTGKNYGSERGCNSFLNVSFVPIAPQSVTREDHDGISHNLITQENYEFLRDSYFRYAGLLNVDAPHDRGKSIGKALPTSIMNSQHSWMKRCM